MRLLILYCGLAFHPALASSYVGKLEFVFGDLKRPLACQQGCVTLRNYKAIIDGLHNDLRCNGLRIGIDPQISNPRKYPAVYEAVLKYARSQGMHIYANPLGTGHFGKEANQFADWVAAYANEFKPDFVGVFNEASFSNADYVYITKRVRSKLNYTPKLIGPDEMHLQFTLSGIQKNDALASVFDIIGSHNAAWDGSATESNWRALAKAAGGKQVWSTENPCRWNGVERVDMNLSQPILRKPPPSTCATYGGVKPILESGGPLQGLVVYLAFPDCVDASGKLTSKGRGIADGISRQGSVFHV